MNEILIDDELGDWRRTHYSNQLHSAIGNEVVIMGWVSSVRDHGNIQFILIRDIFGEAQIIAKKNQCPNEIYEKFLDVKEHTSIGIKGKVNEQKKSPNGVEITPLEIKIFSNVKKASPIVVQNKTPIGIDTRLDLRALDLRRKTLQSIFIIRNTALRAIREFLFNENFIEVNTPKIIATATEGGTALFPIFYYDREAFLAQSPQVYKEQLTMAFDNVFEIGPIFRAEPSRTNRHLSEATSIDIEKAFVNYNDIMNLVENLIKHIIKRIRENNNDEIDYMNIQLPNINNTFPRYTYTELIDRVNEKYEGNAKWGYDLSPQMIKKLGNDINEKFYFITDWPTATKPFYVKEKEESQSNNENKKICESFDLMFDVLEISSGSTRISNRETIEQRMRKQGLNLDSFDYHLRVFDYGMPPHAGCGIGLERLLMTITKSENIRDAVLYPRDIDRLTP